jgi:hypothetical protein
MIDETKNKQIQVLSLQDYTPQEHFHTYYSREEYMQMRDSIKHIIRFLKYRMYPPASTQLSFCDDNDLCIRGLECLADDYVNLHRKRTRELSLAAVLTSQNMENTISQSGGAKYAAEVVAQAYQVHTVRAQSIAGRWGHFDALDAGIKDVTPEIVGFDC